MFGRRVISFHSCKQLGIIVHCETKYLFVIILNEPVGRLNKIGKCVVWGIFTQYVVMEWYRRQIISAAHVRSWWSVRSPDEGRSALTEGLHCTLLADIIGLGCIDNDNNNNNKVCHHQHHLTFYYQFFKILIIIIALKYVCSSVLILLAASLVGSKLFLGRAMSLLPCMIYNAVYISFDWIWKCCLRWVVSCDEQQSGPFIWLGLASNPAGMNRSLDWGLSWVSSVTPSYGFLIWEWLSLEG